jgi:hypothetical protein
LRRLRLRGQRLGHSETSTAIAAKSSAR